MSCQVGGQNVTAIKWCNAQGTLVDVASVQKEGNTLWTKASPPVSNALTFTANTDGSSITFEHNGSGPVIEYNLNDLGWVSCPSGTYVSLQNQGEFVRLRGFNYKTNSGWHTRMTGSISASGNISSLVDCSGENPTCAIFTNQLLYKLFYDCSSLTSVPNLNVTSLIDGCYEQMFENCTLLSGIPNLLAPSLGNNTTDCYRNMFTGCPLITTVNMKTGCGYDPSVHGVLASDHAITINYI